MIGELPPLGARERRLILEAIDLVKSLLTGPPGATEAKIADYYPTPEALLEGVLGGVLLSASLALIPAEEQNAPLPDYLDALGHVMLQRPLTFTRT